MKHVLSVCIAAVMLAAIFLTPANAQQAMPTDEQVNEAVALTRAGLASDRKQVIAANMEMTSDEAAKFWPVFDAYQKAMAQVSDRRVAVILKYARNAQTLTDAMAAELVNEAMKFERERVQARETWAPKFAAVLPGKKFARFYQLENKIDALINVALAQDIPLVK